jgi:diguanylate cyclase (GGDEF)-like protein
VSNAGINARYDENMNIRNIERTTAFKILLRHLGFYRGDPTSQELEKLAEIRRRMLLVIRIRWILVLLLCAYGLFAGILSRWTHPAALDSFLSPHLAFSLLAVIFYNLFYRLLYRELSHFLLINQLQILLDIILLTVIIHYSGGVSSPLCSLYPFLAMEATLLLEKKRDYWGCCIAASCVFGVLVFGETGVFALSLPTSFGGREPLSSILVWLWVVSLNAAITSIGSLVVGTSRRREEAMKHLVVKDQMTNLYNREYFFKELNSEIQRSIRYNHVFSLVFLDIDDLKKINDTFGHLEGDRLLRELAHILRNNSRRSETDPPYDIDVPCRYGGDEFAVLLPETPIGSPGGDGRTSDGMNAAAFAERIRREAEGLSFYDSRVTVSIGIASFPRHGRMPDDLVRSADEALYRSKHCGKNSFMLAGESEPSPQNGISSSGLNEGSSYPGAPPNPAESSATFAPP